MRETETSNKPWSNWAILTIHISNKGLIIQGSFKIDVKR